VLTTPPAAPVPLTDEQKRDLIKKSALWDMHIHIGWYSAPAKSFVEKTIQLIADIEAAHGITKGQP
jgi:N-acyl-D-aspartate/D-glutamate deacylase